jgi:hypothetical protein
VLRRARVDAFLDCPPPVSLAETCIVPRAFLAAWINGKRAEADESDQGESDEEEDSDKAVQESSAVAAASTAASSSVTLPVSASSSSLSPGNAAEAFAALRCEHGKWDLGKREKYRFVSRAAWDLISHDLGLNPTSGLLAPDICLACTRHLHAQLQRVAGLRELLSHALQRPIDPSKDLSEAQPHYAVMRGCLVGWLKSEDMEHASSLFVMRNSKASLEDRRIDGHLTGRLLCVHNHFSLVVCEKARRQVTYVNEVTWQVLSDLYPSLTDRPIRLAQLPSDEEDRCLVCEVDAQVRKQASDAGLGLEEYRQWSQHYNDDLARLGSFITTRALPTAVMSVRPMETTEEEEKKKHAEVRDVRDVREWSVVPAIWHAALDAFLKRQTCVRPPALDLRRDLLCEHNLLRWDLDDIKGDAVDTMLVLCDPAGFAALQQHALYRDPALGQRDNRGIVLSLQGAHLRSSVAVCRACVERRRGGPGKVNLLVRILHPVFSVHNYVAPSAGGGGGGGGNASEPMVRHTLVVTLPIEATLRELKETIEARTTLAHDTQKLYLGHLELADDTRTLGQYGFSLVDSTQLLCATPEMEGTLLDMFKQDAAIRAAPGEMTLRGRTTEPGYYNVKLPLMARSRTPAASASASIDADCDASPSPKHQRKRLRKGASPPTEWSCDQCTFFNSSNAAELTCRMCGTLGPSSSSSSKDA